MSTAPLVVCIVGAGPRGLSVLERLCANERQRPSHPSVTVHLVDPARPGAGQVWRTDQPRELLMNTVASQVTLYTDSSVDIEGPIEPGPSLYTWARHLGALSELERILGGHDDVTLSEATALGPDDYPTRALYGSYLEDAFREVVTAAPEHVNVTVHRSLATALDGTSGSNGQDPLSVALADGTRLDGLDSVVLALGHVPSRKQPGIARTAKAAGLPHLLPANPADTDTSFIAAEQPVLLRGLGLNFFDHMALLTVGRGGSFDRNGERLRYRRSGREPRLIAGSRRGIPYHARGENQKGAHGRHTPRVLTQEVIDDLAELRKDGFRLDFSTTVWPLVATEVESVYYETLLTAQGRHRDAQRLVEAFLVAPDEKARAAVALGHGVAASDLWRWDHVERPYGDRRFTNHADFRAWLLDYLRQDIRRAGGGNLGDPHKAALDVLRDLRNEIRLVVDHAGLDGDSHRDELEGWYTGLNAFLSIGPPVSRIEEMVALMEAGVLDVVGPGLTIAVDHEDSAFVAESTAVPGARFRAAVLIEARLPDADLRQTAAPLLRHMLDAGQCRTFRIPAACGRTYETGGLDVTERPYRVVDAHGRAHPRVFGFGVPTEAVHWVTAAGTRPGVNSVTLVDSDAIARAVLALPSLGRQTLPAPRHDAASSGQLTEVTA
ncbi:FAD binding domain-containing protein [Streptomyces sp. MUSC 125]|uniref:FAD/NAD(P)-binding protein n=1 Tax=unclassified Streptomyces TaxID=2593676 RepID=UPI00057C93B2|nr:MULTISPECIES: FAD/NAD(P)-binding protein [unclassified Streptomyces]KIE28525.1 FAD binding domain-containing protein [Streptomyces sp. MUSC 125]MCH0560278.1 FAD/NAD(P)-binding protein [Streptomyces sp. MUM 16J]